MDKMVYCHKNYIYNITTIFAEGNWYEISKIDTVGDSTKITIIGLGVPLNFYKNDKTPYTRWRTVDIESFTEFFYTKEEYREIQLEELLS